VNTNVMNTSLSIKLGRQSTEGYAQGSRLPSCPMYYKLDCPRVCFDVSEGGPLPSLYGPGGRVTDLETNLSQL
jgi:hypothetical protein